MMVSVIICTHNPRPDYLGRVFDGLALQQPINDKWEVLLIDNKSKYIPQVNVTLKGADIRIIREDELGLTPARARGLHEARGEIIVYVDDDNILAPNYLSEVLRIGREWPSMGAWGAGALSGEFELSPPIWMEPYLWYLTVHEVAEDRWTNQPDLSCFPPGAGLAVRRLAAQKFFEVAMKDPLRRSLDRRGSNLSSCGDMDLLWTLTESGWGVGRFVKLRIRHLISGQRVDEVYFERMVSNQWCSNVLLKYVHGVNELDRPETFLRKFRRWRYERSLLPRERWLFQAQRKGRLHAAEIVSQIGAGNRVLTQSL